MRPAQIFVVEDEAIIAQDLKQCLIRMGYEVPQVLSSGVDALEKIKAQRPDLVLMDIVLKGNPDGVETARSIQEKFKIPVVYLTAYGDQNTFDRARQTEPSGYLLKPVDEGELKKAIDFALTKKIFDEKREAAEKARQRMLSLLMAVLDASPEGILVLNDKKEPVQWNKNFLKIWRLPDSFFYSGQSLSLDLLLEGLQEPEPFRKKLDDLIYGLCQEEKTLLRLKDGRGLEIGVKAQEWGEKERCLILNFREVP